MCGWLVIVQYDHCGYLSIYIVYMCIYNVHVSNQHTCTYQFKYMNTMAPVHNRLGLNSHVQKYLQIQVTCIYVHCTCNNLNATLYLCSDVKRDNYYSLQSLGEMVIGAFKHAGRRRMAFRVGAMIAQFHKDLGLVTEAEELLSDICKFYSEDQWIQLSTKAYSLLADCQMKLRLEDK